MREQSKRERTPAYERQLERNRQRTARIKADPDLWALEQAKKREYRRRRWEAVKADPELLERKRRERRESARRKSADPEWREIRNARSRAALARSVATPEGREVWRRRKREYARHRWHTDPLYRERQIQRLRIRNADPAYRQRQREYAGANKARTRAHQALLRVVDPETQARHRLGLLVVRSLGGGR